ncbi:MAG: hypothetical protein GXY06_09150 [Clostridiaceae bacterium]|nr:hypothetical protein [Clostridiaceae bacterium]
MKRVFGKVETVFNVAYLLAATVLGVLLLTGPFSSARFLSGVMIMVLVAGDAFHLVPRIRSIIEGDDEPYRIALGRGKQITSVTMTLFYVLLWHLGLILFDPIGHLGWTVLVYLSALIRVILCLMPGNRWTDRYPPVRWGIFRNVPFLVLGLMVAGLFFVYRENVRQMGPVWLAVTLSFAFYLPVVIFSNRQPKIGMLMLPKTLMYVWIAWMFLSL